MATAVFALVFRVIPDATVRWRDAWVGGAFTAALFTVGRLVLGVYLGREKNASVFDAAGSVVALLVWVYYSAQLVLFGAEFTFVYATRKQPRSMHT
jgi:membrane protein